MCASRWVIRQMLWSLFTASFISPVSEAMLVRSGQTNPFVLTYITGLIRKHLVVSGVSRVNMGRALTLLRHGKSHSFATIGRREK
jgi:hypothetical protein